MTEKITFPDIDVGDAIRLFESASRSNPLLKKAYDLCATGQFVDDDGKVDNIKDNGVSLDEGGLIYFLIDYLSPNITFETGFGGGASACVFVGAKNRVLYSKRKCTHRLIRMACMMEWAKSSEDIYAETTKKLPLNTRTFRDSSSNPYQET